MSRHLTVSLFGLAILTGTVLRLLNLGQTAWQFDEIVYHLVASNMLQHGQLTEKTLYGQAYSEFLYEPPWYLHLLAGWFWLTKPTIYSARVLGVVFSVGTLTLSWFMVRRLAGERCATFAVVPLAFDGWLIYVQRVSYIENLILLVITAGLLLYQRALDQPSWRRFLAAGLVLGAACCLKYTGCYILLGLALSWVIQRRQHAGHGIALGSAFGLLAVDQAYLVLRYGSGYTSDTFVQVRRVLGLQKSGGTLTSPRALLHLLFAQYDIFIASFLVALGGLVIALVYLIRCYRARSWQPVQHDALLFSWAAAGVVTFGLSSLRYPQYFALILLPLYLLFWTTLWRNPRRSVGYAACGVAVIAGLASYHFSTARQSLDPYVGVQHYMAAHVPARAVVLADEQIGDLLTQPFCREQDATPCLHHASYAVTWDTYLQQTQKLGDAAFHDEFKGATKLYSARGFSGIATVWKLAVARPNPVLGVDVATDQDYSLRQARAYGERLMPYIAHTLDATSVGIVWDLCDPSFTSDQVTSCKQSLSVADVRALVALAHASKLTVQLRPIIRVGSPRYWNDPGRSWEGIIQPRNQARWFASLLDAEKPYLALLHSGQMVTGTELARLRYSREWPAFLRNAARYCHGCSVSMAIWHEAYYQGLQTGLVSSPGVDWYPTLSLPADASQGEVTAAWEATLRRVPSSVLTRTTLDEESIRATAGAYHHTADWNVGGRPDATVQARYFIAACETVKYYGMAGIYFYDIPLNDNPARPTQFPAFFVGNAGTKAIAECARLLGVGEAAVPGRSATPAVKGYTPLR